MSVQRLRWVSSCTTRRSRAANRSATPLMRIAAASVSTATDAMPIMSARMFGSATGGSTCAWAVPPVNWPAVQPAMNRPAARSAVLSLLVRMVSSPSRISIALLQLAPRGVDHGVALGQALELTQQLEPQLLGVVEFQLRPEVARTAEIADVVQQTGAEIIGFAHRAIRAGIDLADVIDRQPRGARQDDHELAARERFLNLRHVRPSEAHESYDVVGVLAVLCAAVLPAVGIGALPDAARGPHQLGQARDLAVAVARDVKRDA